MQYTTETNLENILAKFGSEAVAYQSFGGKQAFVFPLDNNVSKQESWKNFMTAADGISTDFKQNGGTISDLQEILEADDEEMKNLFGDDWKTKEL